MPEAARRWAEWLAASGEGEAAAGVEAALAVTPSGVAMELPGPVGERNVYRIEGRGVVLCVASERSGVLEQVGLALATGNRARVRVGALDRMRDGVEEVEGDELEGVDAVLFAGEAGELRAVGLALARRECRADDDRLSGGM